MKNQVIINGGYPLNGSASVQGSKNASLPILAASLLFKNEVILHNIPDLSDIRVMLDILSYLGAHYTYENGTVTLDMSDVKNRAIPENFSNQLRASSLLIGPLLARFNECEIGMPGGCAIGNRPLDIHFKGFQNLGCNVYVESGIIRSTTDDVKGTFALDFPSVGATENFITSAVYTNDSVTLNNIAVEPEVINLIEFLQAGGANVRKHDQASVTINGVDELKSVEFNVQADRIEAATLLTSGLATKGDVTIHDVETKYLSIPLQKFSDMGAHLTVTDNSVRVKHDGKLEGTTIKTSVYPGFPTDMQSLYAVLLTQADTSSMIVETIFNSRFRYIDELIKMNARISVEGNIAHIEPGRLSGCKVESHDLRGSASMILSGLVADGVTRVTNLEYLHRGYEQLIEKLEHLGSDIYYV